jgi:uncharacterized protein (TIGR02145 family)
MGVKIFLGFIIVNFMACDKEKPSNPMPPEDGEVAGKIILPPGTSINVNTLVVESSTDLSNVSSDQYKLGLYGTYACTYVSNPVGDVVMMGYKYPGITNNDITSTSTALGMIMMSPSVLDLSEMGKETMVQNLLKDSKFTPLVAEIENAIRQGKPLFDSTNATMKSAVNALFKSATFRTASVEATLPVSIFSSGRNFAFNNSGKAYTTVVGIYKDSNRVQKLVVDGIKIVPNSLSDLFAGNGGFSGNPVDKSYTLVGDGDFTIKMRTGLPGFDDGSPEFDEAFYENLGGFSFNLISTVFPAAPTCRTTIVNNTFNLVQGVSGISTKSNVGEVLLTITDIVLNNVKDLLDNCTGVTYVNEKWFRKFLGHWNFVGKVFSFISNGANTTIFGTQWALAAKPVDTCFNVKGSTVTATDCGGVKFFTDPRDGQVYPYKKIGTQVWMTKNLNYAAAGSLCYDNNPANCAIYGRLYNWNTALTVAPPGWHLPSDSEWAILINYLGGESVAGGKMKTTTGWNSPNEGATNSSGFSGLPGGIRRTDGSYGNDRFLGYWWSSTAGSSPSAWGLQLANEDANAERYSANIEASFSVRCIRD